jgi:hypothetical protein
VTEAAPDQFRRLVEFLNELDERSITYDLTLGRSDGLRVTVMPFPGQLWEIDFLLDGQIDIERFLSEGDVVGEELLSEFWRLLDDLDRE